MARRERLPESGTPQIPQGIMGTVDSARGRMRGRALLETMPLAQKLTELQQESNQRLRTQLEPILIRAGQHAERVRLQSEPDAGPPELSPPDQSLFQINAIYQALYDSGRAQVYGARLYEEHARILELKRKNPAKKPHTGRFGEPLPYDEKFQGEDGFFLNPDAFAVFSRDLERRTLESLKEADPSGTLYTMMAPKLSELHASERQKAEETYQAYLMAKAKEVTDTAIAENRKLKLHEWRQMIEGGPQGTQKAFEFFKQRGPQGFKADLQQFIKDNILTNPAFDVFYAGKKEQFARETNDEMMMEFWRGLVAQARMNGQDLLLEMMATWLNTDEANILYNKEELAIAAEALDSARQARIEEWIEMAKRATEDFFPVGGIEQVFSDRAGIATTFEELWRQSFLLVPGRDKVGDLSGTGWTARQKTIDQVARFFDYILDGVQWAFTFNEKNEPEALRLSEILDSYKPVMERLQSVTDTNDALYELENGIPIKNLIDAIDNKLKDDAVDSNVKEKLKRQRAKLQAMGEKDDVYRPPLVAGGNAARFKLIETFNDAMQQLRQNPGDAARLSGYATAFNPNDPSATKPVKKALDQILTEKWPSAKDFASYLRSRANERAVASGLVMKALYGEPSTGLDSEDAKALLKVLPAAVSNPESGNSNVPLKNRELARLVWAETLKGVREGKQKVGDAAPSEFIDPQIWTVLQNAADDRMRPLVLRLQGALALGNVLQSGLDLNREGASYAASLFNGALKYQELKDSKAFDFTTIDGAINEKIKDEDIQAFVSLYAGGVDKDVAARRLLEAIAGYALLDLQSFEKDKFEDNFEAKIIELSERLNAKQSFLRANLGNVLGNVSIDLGDFPVGEKKEKLASGLAKVFHENTLNHVLGTNSYTLLPVSVPVVHMKKTEKGAEEWYLMFYYRGAPLAVQTADRSMKRFKVNLSSLMLVKDEVLEDLKPGYQMAQFITLEPDNIAER